MDFIGGAILIALVVHFIGSFVLSFPLWFTFFLLLQLFLQKWRQITKKEIEKSQTIVNFLKKSLILSVISSIFFPVSTLPVLFKTVRYQLEAVPSTYPYVNIANVRSSINQNFAVVNFNINVVKSGRYSVRGEFPCYKQVSPTTQEDSYPIALSSNQPNQLTISFAFDEFFNNDSKKNSLCKNRFLRLMLWPEGSSLLGDDTFVVFTGNAQEVKNNRMIAEIRKEPYVYIPQFNFNTAR